MNEKRKRRRLDEIEIADLVPAKPKPTIRKNPGYKPRKRTTKKRSNSFFGLEPAQVGKKNED